MRARFALPVTVATLLLCVDAQGAPRTQIARGDGAAKIVTYDSLCDEDNAVECLIAEIGCGTPGDFTAGLYNLDSKAAASLFAKANGKGVVAAGGRRWDLQVTKVALSEHSYNWDVTLLSLDKGAEIWRAVWGTGEIQLQAGPRSVVLRRADVEEEAFRAVVSTCAAAR